MRLINMLLVIWPVLSVGELIYPTGATEKSLFVCYGKIDPNSVVGYKLVVLEAGHFNFDDIQVFKNNNEKVIAYISLTEVNENSHLFQELEPYCMGENTNWNSRIINIAHKGAKEVLLNEILKIENQGFDGVFLDNLDNVSHWGMLKGKEKELINLLETIRKKHPQFYLCQNSGIFLNGQLADLTDAIVIESLVTNYDFEKQDYVLREKESKKQMLKKIKHLKTTTDKPIYALEYTNEPVTMAKVAKELSSYKLQFYITQINLQYPSQFLKQNK